MQLPPPGKPMTLSVPDFIERNFITNSQPQKVSPVGCSGLANTRALADSRAVDRSPARRRRRAALRRGRRRHTAAGRARHHAGGRQLRLGSARHELRLTRRGRNPLIVLATLAGEPCAEPCSGRRFSAGRRGALRSSGMVERPRRSGTVCVEGTWTLWACPSRPTATGPPGRDVI